jgi:hypothetical protein
MGKIDSDQAFPDYRPVVAERDNFNKEKYVNLAWINSQEVVPKQREGLGGRTVSFNIDAAAPGHVIPLDCFRMGLKLRLVDPDGAPPANGHVVAPINYFCQTMIKQVEIFFNDVCVFNSGPYYAQRALFDAWLNRNTADRDGTLRTQGFIPDPAAHLETAALASTAFRGRALFFGTPNNVGAADPAANQVVYDNDPRTFYVPLITDLTDIEEPLISQVDIRVNIEFHDDTHVLWMTGDAAVASNFKLDIVSADMRVKLMQCSEGYERSLEAKLEKAPIKYRHKRIEPKPLSIPANSSTLSSSNITQSSTNPERIMILMQPERLTRSGYEENPLNFGSIFRAQGWDPDNNLRPVSNLVGVSVAINGAPLVRQTADNASSLARLHHQEMTEKTGSTHYGNGFPFYHFERGNYVQLYDCTKSGRGGTSGSVRQPTKQGTLSLDLQFSQPLHETLQVLILQEYNASFTINKNRSVVTQYLD